jgi:integration host factor subunit beta
MTRADLAEQVHDAIGEPLLTSDVVVCAIFDSIARALRSGDKVEIRADSEASTPAKDAGASGAIPETGSRIEVPPKRIAFFKPSKNLRELVGTWGA